MADGALPLDALPSVARMPEAAQGIVMPGAPLPHRAPRREPMFYAALDLGTNNCRLLVGAPTQNGFRVVDSFSRIVRLGEGLAATGRLSQAAMDRAVDALSACADKLARRRMRGFSAVATEACRRAANGPEFLARVAAETGITPRIIGGREEAQLALASCAPLLTHGDRRAILFDIGGGSTEIAWVRLPPPGAHGTEPILSGTISIPVGVVTLAERAGESCFTREGFEAVRDEVAEKLRAFDAVHCIAQEIRQGGVRLIGTSGTVTTLAGTVLDLPRYRRQWVDGVCLDAEEADAALEKLFCMGREGLANHPCIGPERADFVLPGCAVYAAIRHVWPVQRLTVADRGLREGMLLKLIQADRAMGRW